MKRADAFAARARALATCHAVRGECSAATNDALTAYRAHTLVVLAAAAAVGLLLAKSRAGESLVNTATRVAGGPGWRFVQQILRKP